MRTVIIGGGACGLGAALLLARDGHEVTVLERDGDTLPDSPPAAWDGWTRKGVAQFRQPHNLMPGLRLLLERELPDIQRALEAHGASRFDFTNPLPPFFNDRSPRPIDDQLWTYTARRPVFEWVLGAAAAREPRIAIRRGARVAELLTGRSAIPGTPHVTGVRTDRGDEIPGDLVVDASGRASCSPEWLESIGAQRPYEEREDCGFAYYTRYFRGAEPERRGPVLMDIGTISVLTLPGDNGTWSVTVFCASGDQRLKNLRDADKWTSVIRACPLQAHWLDGEPITDVLPMAGIVDRYRRFTVDGTPAATGFTALADAWACTNPSAGRGLTVGFLHALQLRDTLREAAERPDDLVRRFDERTEATITPWYRAQIAADRARFAEIEALREGRQPAPPTDPLARNVRTLLLTMAADPDLFRAALEYVATITPVQEILERPEVAQRMAASLQAMQGAPPPALPGPDRQQLLALLA
jgi:2-polyprenyl-6-methoxyphenol hydroxylase-like FAD-dependent oxidoreductase